jgi:hypothetical protein
MDPSFDTTSLERRMLMTRTKEEIEVRKMLEAFPFAVEPEHKPKRKRKRVDEKLAAATKPKRAKSLFSNLFGGGE